MKKATVDIEILSSHNFDDIGFKALNKYSINKEGKVLSKIVLSGEFNEDTPESAIKEYLENKKFLISVALSKDEINPHYGTPYTIIDWKSYREENINKTIEKSANAILLNDTINLTEHITAASTRIVNYSEIENIYNNCDFDRFLVENFYLGLKSNISKSKFFHFFIIIEYLENSKEYIELFNHELLFSEKEIKKINKFANCFIERKRSTLISILNRTLKTRKEKLFTYLSTIIPDLNCTQEDISELIEQRNKLFHSSNKFNSKLLYKKLFYII